MTTAYAIQTVLEILAVLFVVYGILNEKKFVAFENKICRLIKRKIYLYRKRKAVKASKVKKAVYAESHYNNTATAQKRRAYSVQNVA